MNRTTMMTSFFARFTSRLGRCPLTLGLSDRCNWLPHLQTPPAVLGEGDRHNQCPDLFTVQRIAIGMVVGVGVVGLVPAVPVQATQPQIQPDRQGILTATTPLPPPPVTFGTPLQTAAPTSVPGAEYDFRAPRPVAPIYTPTPTNYIPAPTSLPTYSAPTTYQPGRYMVFVNGNSPMLLDQVKRVEPGAFLRSLNGSTIIQAGRFGQVTNARLRISELESMGIGARIAEVPGEASPGMTPPPTTSVPVAPVGAAPSGLEMPMADGSKGYFVVIPGSDQELSGIAAQISQMGLSTGVRQSNNPYGPHIAVGPFGQRDAAVSWQRYLNSNGMKNARVFFQR